MDKKKWYKLLGLTKSEIKVFESLKDFKNIAEISRDTNIARMSVHVIIKRLISRGMIIIVNIGKRKEYYINKNITTEQISINEKDKIQIHRGVDQLLIIWDSLSDIKNQKSIIYQSCHSLVASLNKLKLHNLLELNDKTSKSKHISEAYLENGYLDAAKKILDEKDYLSWKKSLKRTSSVYNVRSVIFNSDSEILVVNDRVYITDWDKELSIEIKSKNVSNIFKQFIKMLNVNSNKANFNADLDL